MTVNKLPVKEFIEMSDGAYIYAEHYPNSDKPLVLFIPGFCCTTKSFDKNAPILAENYEIVVYDPRGQGNSSKGLFGHTVARNAKDIREIIMHYGNYNVSVVAWSMAGQFIMDYVRQFGSEFLDSITLADCPLNALGNELWNSHGLKGGNMDYFNEHLIKSYNHWDKYCKAFAVKIWSEINDDRIKSATLEFMKTPPWIAFAIYSDMVFRNGFPYLAKANIPMLFTGADSKVTENGKDLASKWYPKARSKEWISETYVFDHGGHVFFDVEADKFNDILKSFLQRNVKCLDR